ncbi:translation initiation factor 2 [Lysinibacillus sp. NPDC096418]|uniref:translation initiation factor 2 n=1 Tax=Lysinibacillus sp. NPDC096418 TaxID=3364138 RepID=UPI003816EB6E
MKEEKNKLNKSSELPTNYSSKIKNIGESIFALGDDLLELALELATDAFENVNSKSSQSTNEQFDNAESLQKQIDQLISELKGIKNILK